MNSQPNKAETPIARSQTQDSKQHVIRAKLSNMSGKDKARLVVELLEESREPHRSNSKINNPEIATALLAEFQKNLAEPKKVPAIPVQNPPAPAPFSGDHGTGAQVDFGARELQKEHPSVAAIRLSGSQTSQVSEILASLPAAHAQRSALLLSLFENLQLTCPDRIQEIIRNPGGY